MATVHVNSPNVYYSENHIAVEYEYTTTNVEKSGDRVIVSKHFVSQISFIYIFLCFYWFKDTNFNGILQCFKVVWLFLKNTRFL